MFVNFTDLDLSLFELMTEAEKVLIIRYKIKILSNITNLT